MPSGPCLARGIEVAQFFHDHDHYTDAIALHIHQALAKYLKGFLLKNGWTLQKTHDLINLASQAGNFGIDLRDDCEDALDRINECYRSRGPDSIERCRLPAMHGGCDVRSGCAAFLRASGNAGIHWDDDKENLRLSATCGFPGRPSRALSRGTYPGLCSVRGRFSHGAPALPARSAVLRGL
ncbi:MAG TPA: hypothetical protein DDZ84_10500 [Firmicutes bacterium]|nr:hypothetical protein [Bacillota bacterium]